MIKICERCGEEFETNASRALYCADCRKKKQVERNRKYAEKRKNGDSRSVGSTQICPICNNEYILKTGSQLCCDNCRGKQKYQRELSKGYVNNSKGLYDPYTIRLKKGTKEILTKTAKENNMSLNELINTAIAQFVEKIENKS